MALDINWGSISSIQCADGDAGAVVRFFFIAGAYFRLVVLRALFFSRHSCSLYKSGALCRDIRRLMASLQ